MLYLKITSKWAVHLNTKTKPIKLREGNVEERFAELIGIDFFFEIRYRIMNQIFKLDFIKILSCDYLKDIVKKMKKQATGWENT
jgi:hypothetical protein